MAQTVDFKGKRATTLAGTTTDTLAFCRADATTTPVILYVPSNVKKFRVRAGGKATGGTTTNFTPTIYKGTSATAASNTVIAALTARAVDSATGTWDMSVDCTLDETNSKMVVRLTEGHNGLTPTIESAAIKTSLSSITSLSQMPISVFGAFSAANASNTATLDYFTLQVLEQKA